MESVQPRGGHLLSIFEEQRRAGESRGFLFPFFQGILHSRGGGGMENGSIWVTVSVRSVAKHHYRRWGGKFGKESVLKSKRGNML